VTSFELREEIDHGGRKYFLQTSLLSDKGLIQSSFFKNGVLFDTIQVSTDGKASADELKKAAKQVHVENKSKFLVILNVSGRVGSSDDFRPHLRIAQALFRRRLYEEALQEAQKSIDKGNKDSLPHMIIGESYYEMGNLAKAFEATSVGIAINPKYPDIHNLMGKIFLKQNQCRRAIECFNRAIELNLYYGEPYFNLARTYLLNTIVKEDYELSKDLDGAVLGNLERAAQLDPFLIDDAFDDAKSLVAAKNYQAAYEVLEAARKKPARRGVEEIVLDLYLMLLNDGEDLKEDEIEKYLGRVREVVDQHPTFADGYNSLGILYTAKCKIFMDRASKAFRKALEINGDYQKAKKNLRLSENDRQGIFILLKALLD
jgi:tetratricopeptide (TPR) repeat protein